MATTTPRIGLTKPDGTDLVDIAVLNTNFDKIDSNIASTKIQSTKPATANAGDLWWDSNTGTLYLYYVDANSAQWVAATSDPVNIGVVANQTERDAQYPTPGQGMRVYRTDLGVTQTYYGLYNVSTNPGGRDVAGWYNEEKNDGLVPIQPTSVVFSGGTGSVNSLGVVNFTNVSNITINGVFSSKFKNYQIVFSEIIGSNAATTGHYFRLAASGVTSGVSYYTAGAWQRSGGTSALEAQSNTAQWNFSYLSSQGRSSGTIKLMSPAIAIQTTGQSHYGGVDGTGSIMSITTAFWHGGATSYDGFGINPSAGDITGSIQVFGLLDK